MRITVYPGIMQGSEAYIKCIGLLRYKYSIFPYDVSPLGPIQGYNGLEVKTTTPSKHHSKLDLIGNYLF